MESKGICDCLMLIFTAMSGIGATVAVAVTFIIYKRQKRIALFDRRMKILNDFEYFVMEVIPDPKSDISSRFITRYTRNEVVTLFDENFGILQDEIIKAFDECNMLEGDYQHAIRKGDCHGKGPSEIANDQKNKEDAIIELYKAKRDEAYKKWLKI